MQNRQTWIAKAREQLTEAAFSSLEQSIKQSPDASFEILDSLFAVERSDTAGPGRVFLSLVGSLDPKASVGLCLSKFQGELTNMLRQIKDFVGATDAKADQAVVFFSGIDEWEPEWAVLWEALEGRETWACELVQSIKQDVDKLIGIPFELIVGRYQKKERGPSGEVHYGPIEYVPFPWQSDSMSS